MIEVLLIGITLLIIVDIFITIRFRNKQNTLDYSTINNAIQNYEKSLDRIDKNVKDEFLRNREEFSNNFKDIRGEISSSFNRYGDSVNAQMLDISKFQKDQLEAFSNQLTTLTKLNEDKLQNIQSESNKNSKLNREELSNSLKSFEDRFNLDVKELNEHQKQKFDALIQKQTEMIQVLELNLDKIRETVESKLKSMQEDNNTKLEKMRETVDEKLHSTLEKRLGESFRQVSERLEAVHKGLGEMQTLAIGVGDLKKVLSNVKTKGILGEYQLANLLEQILAPDQFSKDVKTKVGSNASVEFAVKLPGRNDKDKTVWLPIDSKFPSEVYQKLLDAYEVGNPQLIDEAVKKLVSTVKLCAKDIREKYLDPPNTTDFGIMFLPFEGLYAEVLRNIGLFEIMQREFKITITGPTTLSAFLNSLQMGFRTLAIEKRSSEVWELLAKVKTEFGDFGSILDKTKKKLDEASNNIDRASTKTRVIARSLKDVQILPKSDSVNLLSDTIDIFESTEIDDQEKDEKDEKNESNINPDEEKA